MTTIAPFFQNSKHNIPQAVIFLSGSGSNAEKILEKWRNAGSDREYNIAALFTDSPAKSRARELAQQFDVPYIENDIRAFYKNKGLDSLSIAHEAGQKARREWTDSIREQLAPYKPDFGILAGFARLCNITEDFPCLNIHPGDLTYIKDGKRYLTGLHTIPVEKAILEGLDHLRSSVIIAQKFSSGGKGMDSGPILGISQAVHVDLRGTNIEELRRCQSQRPEKKPKGGYEDKLEQVAEENLEKLKKQGDWVVFPQTVQDFASGKFAVDDADSLWYRGNGKWLPIQTVVYREQDKEVLFRNP